VLDISTSVLRASIGALLHDVGKIGVQVPGRDASVTQFECETPGQHRSFGACTSCGARYGQAHAAAGGRLVSETLGRFPGLAALVAEHHRPERSRGLVEVITRADHLSAGERDDREEASDRIPALVNPLARSTTVRLRPAPLGQQLGLAAVETKEDAESALGVLWGELRRALEMAARYAGDDLEALADHALGAVYRAAFGTPSAFYHAQADISLASHSHLAAAIAGALASGGTLPAEGKESFAVIAGDISGIQEYVHGGATRNAARSLRARSFFLQLLSHVAARFVARECGVPPTAIVDVVGGHFTVLAPVTALAQLPAIRRAVDRAVFETEGVGLAVALGGATIDTVELIDYRKVREKVGREVSLQKYRRYLGSLAEVAPFVPRAAVAEGEVCAVCGRERGTVRRRDDDDDGERLCPRCHNLEALGRQLAGHETARFLTIKEVSPKEGEGWAGLFLRLGFEVTVQNQAPEAPFAGAIYALDDDALAEVPCARYLPVARIPTDRRGRARGFDEIAGQESGRPLLAVAKLDVDDLGVVFADHFPAEPRAGVSARKPSPSRIASFGSMLSLFFEGYLAQHREAAFDNLYLVFAGGDDLVCAGAPGQVLAFLQHARRQFGIWTGGNERLHFSAGVTIGSVQRPIAAALEAAEEALDAAKGFVHPEGQDARAPGARREPPREKDAVAIASRGGSRPLERPAHAVMPWAEFDHLVALRQELIGLVEQAHAPRGLLQRLQYLIEIEGPGGTVRYGPAVWRSMYMLRRAGEGRADLARRLLGLHDEALRPGGARRIALAARLAEVATARERG